MSCQILELAPEPHHAHRLHGSDRIWPETSCYADVWIEVLHALGLDPVAGLAFTLSADFDGDQWRFLKYPTEDLRSLYGLEVVEMNPWRGVEAALVDHLALGDLLIVEVDACHLPDTAGTTYQVDHVKTSIAPTAIDPVGRRLRYFHSGGHFELHGNDYLGLFPEQSPDHPAGTTLPLAPYVELVRLERTDRTQGCRLVERTVPVVQDHLRRRPSDNPIRALRSFLTTELAGWGSDGFDQFHACAFATLRQCGAGAELASELCSWLAAAGVPVSDAVQPYLAVASAAKAAQLALARASRGRPSSLVAAMDRMEVAFGQAIDATAGSDGW